MLFLILVSCCFLLSPSLFPFPSLPLLFFYLSLCLFSSTQCSSGRVKGNSPWMLLNTTVHVNGFVTLNTSQEFFFSWSPHSSAPSVFLCCTECLFKSSEIKSAVVSIRKTSTGCNKVGVVGVWLQWNKYEQDSADYVEYIFYCYIVEEMSCWLTGCDVSRKMQQRAPMDRSNRGGFGRGHRPTQQEVCWA